MTKENYIFMKLFDCILFRYYYLLILSSLSELKRELRETVMSQKPERYHISPEDLVCENFFGKRCDNYHDNSAKRRVVFFGFIGNFSIFFLIPSPLQISLCFSVLCSDFVSFLRLKWGFFISYPSKFAP